MSVTPEVKQARDEHLIASIIVLLAANHTIESQDKTLRIGRTEDGRFLVKVKMEFGAFGEADMRDDLFDDARAAVAYYLDLNEPL